MKRNRNSAVAKNKTLGRFARNLSARILMKFVFTSIAYAAVLALLFFLAYIFYDVIGRQIYVFQRLAQTFSGLTSYIQLIFIFCLVFGILVIFVVYWVFARDRRRGQKHLHRAGKAGGAAGRS